MRSRLVQGALVLVSVVAALSLCEVALRAWGSYRPIDDPVRTGRPDLYTADPNVGYTLWPSRTTSYRYPDKSEELIPLISNSDGFRSGREFDERDGRVRILMVGDSFVFGQGVRAEDRVTEQLEALDGRWRVDNMGMTGWGPDLMVRAIEQHGRKAAPDVVVLALYTDDFRRLRPYYAGAGFAFSKFDLVGSELVTLPFPYPRPWERLRIVQCAYLAWWEQDRNRYDLNGALLDRYLKNAQAIGFKPVVVFFPGQADTDEDRQRRGFLAQWTAAHGVPYADLTEAIHGAGVDKVFIRDNWHWNPLGHKIAARGIHDLLRREQLAVARPPGN